MVIVRKDLEENKLGRFSLLKDVADGIVTDVAKAHFILIDILRSMNSSGSSIVENIVALYQNKRTLPYTVEMCMNDILDVIVNGQSVDFGNYRYLESNKSKSKKFEIREDLLKKAMDAYSDYTLAGDIQELFKRCGLVGVANMILFLHTEG